MIASVTEMLELPKFDHITISTILFESHDKILFMMSWKKLGRHIISKYHYSKKA